MLSLIQIYRIKPFIVPTIVLTILTTLLCSVTANVALSTQNQQLNNFRNIQNDNRQEFQHFNRIVKDTNKLFLNDFNLRKTNIERWKRLSETELFTRARRKRRSLNVTNTNINFNSSTKLINISDLVIRSDVESLNLSDKNLVEFKTDLKQFFKLKNFDLSKNNIKSVELINNNLSFLNLSLNNVKKFTSENLTDLQYLDLSCNQISDFNEIKLNFLNKIEEVNLSCNKIDQIPLNLFSPNSTKLTNLNLSFNRLRKISKKTFYNLINIENLILSYNNISEIENDTFTFLPNLQHLDLSYNNIQASSIRSLQGIPDLIGLSLAYNPNLSNALQGFVASWSLKELDASGTNLCQIPAALAQSVRTLKLMDNNFQVIRCGDLDSYPLLQHLILSSCQITDIEDDALGRLEILTTLNLNKNNLFRIPTSLPSNLKKLLLKSNKITDIQSNSFSQLVNLELLDLSENKLTYLPELPLPKLQSLNLRSSGLKGLSQAVVKTSPHLKDLLLENNPIKCADLLGLAEWATPCREIGVINFEEKSVDYFEKWNQQNCDSHEKFHFVIEKIVCPIVDVKFNHLDNDVREQFSYSNDLNKKNNSLFLPILRKINSQDRRLINKNVTNFQDAKHLILSGKENQTKLSDEKWKIFNKKNETTIFMPILHKKIKFNDNKLDDKKIIKSGLNTINININTTLPKEMIINWNENNSISRQQNNENTNIKHQIMDDVILANKMVQVEQTKDVIEKNNVKYEEIKLPTPQTPQSLALKLPVMAESNQRQEDQTGSMNVEIVAKKNVNVSGNGSHIQKNSTAAISMNKKISDGKFVENSNKTVVKNHSDDIYIAENSLNVEIENKIENNMKNNNKKKFVKLTHLPENLLSINSTHPEHWNDIRTTTNHPGTFVIIGATIGMILSLVLVQIYRCVRPWHRTRSHHEEDADQPYTPAHCDLLPMEILNSPIYATDAPLEIW